MAQGNVQRKSPAKDLKLFDLLHPEGFACPRYSAHDGLNVHRRSPETPVVDYRCKGCRRVFNREVHCNTMEGI